ncbi:hypothetical protein V495_03957 [Pseudogymnoascus sp. VKM F-4514 (FW-929)]|nr:hypothetical protein V490_06560 [Pseudogymnoascus sp. VKM F-3557]KFY43400.1 hypothetical protein V495_03957 [Pseudogymnoascus sp. VKM F-4514 (FW-929)]KFY58652.1 hypothetical protein V497_04713 [Pseudogymnoascus sp. VKM F-4516 (FW-969)]
MKLFYVFTLLAATALAAPTEVESSQVLGKRECIPCAPYCAGGSAFLNCAASKVIPQKNHRGTQTNTTSAFVTNITTATASATATTANSASLMRAESFRPVGKMEVCVGEQEKARRERTVRWRLWLGARRSYRMKQSQAVICVSLLK